MHLILAFVAGQFLQINLADWVVYPGLILVAGGLAIAFAAVYQMSLGHTSPDPHTPTSAIVTEGIYRYSRNPIYLGFLYAVIGFPLLIGSPWGLFIAPLQIWVFNKLVIEKEEVYLENKFAQVYLDYKQKVRRWL